MRKEKQLLIDEIQGQLAQYPSFVIMAYKGLSANKVSEFRSQIRQRGGQVEMMSKRLLVKATAASGIALERAHLTGHVGLVYSATEPLETAKFVFKYSEENEKVIEVIGGHIDGQLYSGEQVEALSKLPSKDEMRAQFLATLEAPLAQTLAVMEALLTSVAYCLENKSQQGTKD